MFKKGFGAPFRGFGGVTNMVDQDLENFLENKPENELPLLKDFLRGKFNDEMTEKVYYQLSSSYLTTFKQVITLEENDLIELNFPLGIRKQLLELIEKYKEKNIYKEQYTLEKNQYFQVETRKDGRLAILIKDVTLRQNIQNYLNIDEIFEAEPTVPIEHMLRVIASLRADYGYAGEDEEVSKKIKETFANTSVNTGFGGFGGHVKSATFDKNNPVHHLLKYLYTIFIQELAKIDEMIEKESITYEALWYVFQAKTKVVTLDQIRRKRLEGYRINSANYSRGYYQYFQVNMSNIASNGKFFAYMNSNSYIHSFKGVKPIAELEIMPLKDDSQIYRDLVERGEQYAKLAVGHHYLEYEGSMTRKRFWTSVEEKADGKVMVDISAHNKMTQSKSGLFGSTASNFGGMSLNSALSGGNQNSFEVLPKDHYWMAPSSIPGFSFVNKRWGQLDMMSLKPITFQKEAFDLLVLNQHKKDVIKALVTHSDKAFSDFIENKGRGCIFLLHGPPGVGKTLTAEAIAEYLERPLYAVSVGELGTKPSVLEKNLSDILELAGIWNAVVLVDEADIFLERRSESDIIRNAMVGVFLRVVEYFNGVLFLTSNRVRCLDRAFHSRVSVALKYPDLDAKSRLKIWHHFLEKCGIELEDTIDLNQLASYDLNGRQIRSTIRLACSLAHNDHEKGEPLMLQMKHITDCISISNQFEDFTGSLPELSSNTTTTSS